MMEMTETQALMVLNAISGMTPRRILTLREIAGSFAGILAFSREHLQQYEILPAEVSERLIQFPVKEFLSEEFRKIARSNARVITREDADYPETLRNIEGAPLVLYVKGTLPPEELPALAIVGSRHASLYGMTTAESFARQLSERGIVIVSGLARGIDTAAHRGTLGNRGITVAVLGSGLEHIYPLENRKMAEQIAECGAVISEFPMSTPPHAFNFPRRNRIISGLAQGVLVVEAAQRSGALLTADFALEQGKDVYAVPGKIDSPTASGVNKLIQQGAKLVLSIEDILEDVASKFSCDESRGEASPREEVRAALSELSEEERSVYDQLESGPCHIDELMAQRPSRIQHLSETLIRLEMKRLITQLPGKTFTQGNDTQMIPPTKQSGLKAGG